MSVVINNYNYGRFLKTAIDSALAQTYPHVELIVVDDGSTDNSADVIRSYGGRLRAVFKPNGGQGSCFNAGFAASRGEVVLFLDSDDYYHPRALERVVEASRDGAALIQFRLNVVDSQGRPLAELPAPGVRLDSGDVVPILVSKGWFTGMVTTANAFRRDVLEKVLPLPEKEFAMAADGYLIHRVPFLGRVVAIDEPLGYYRLHGANDSELSRGAGVDLDRVRRRLMHTTRELAIVCAQANERGIPVAPQLPMRRTGHVQLRLVSRKLEPEKHPFAGDSAWRLGLRGAQAAWRDLTLPPQRRALMAGWFVLVGVAPRPVARALIDYSMALGSRPRWARKLLSLW